MRQFTGKWFSTEKRLHPVQMFWLKYPLKTTGIDKINEKYHEWRGWLVWIFYFQFKNSKYVLFLNPIQGVCKVEHPYLDETERRIWGAVGASNFFTLDFIIIHIFCENLGYPIPPIQTLWPFSEEYPYMLWSEPFKIAKLVYEEKKEFWRN